MRRMGMSVIFLLVAWFTLAEPLKEPADAALRQALTFHASFDNGTDADFALGDKKIYTAPSYKKRDEAKPGIGNPDVTVVPQAGRFGSALKFGKKNTHAIFYRAERNVSYSSRDWDGTVSFWLSLDPETDLEPGYCDPIQVTDEAYNDAALWVDFTKENPRQFRLGVFGDLSVWNPKNVPPDENPNFQKRLVTVNSPPFDRGEWTHVAITFSDLNSSQGGSAKLYLNGEPSGKSERISEPFTWDLAQAAIRLGLNYAGLYDEIAVFNRALSDQEIHTLYKLDKGVATLYSLRVRVFRVMSRYFPTRT